VRNLTDIAANNQVTLVIEPPGVQQSRPAERYDIRDKVEGCQLRLEHFRSAGESPACHRFLSPGSHVQDLDLITFGEESVWPFRAQQRHPVVFHQNCFTDERKSFDQIVDVFRSNGFFLAV
jgi:hypothetical protein